MLVSRMEFKQKIATLRFEKYYLKYNEILYKFIDFFCNTKIKISKNIHYVKILILIIVIFSNSWANRNPEDNLIRRNI